MARKIELAYYRKDGRFYQEIARHEFEGFPTDGIWYRTGGAETLILDATAYARAGYDPERVAALFRYNAHLANVLHHVPGGWSYRENSDLLENFLYPNLLPEHAAAVTPVRRLHQIQPRTIYRANRLALRRRYTPIGDEFVGFPESGVWHVRDGKRNHFVKLFDIPEPATRGSVEERHAEILRTLNRALSPGKPRAIADFLLAFDHAASRSPRGEDETRASGVSEPTES